jgi:SAM-dependent methyltransferase
MDTQVRDAEKKMKSAGDDRGPSLAYALGHSDAELCRLSAQARIIDPITRRFFRDAGLIPGMRVLEVGSGAGDVAFLVTELVGATGEVIGADRSPVALEVARARADAGSHRNVFFRDGDPSEMTFDRPFDAVIGRYVLQFQPDPGAMLRKLAGHLRVGGLIAFHETDWDGVRSFPPSPIYDSCCRWIVETLRLRGAEMRMGIKLHSAFVAAGLPAPSMRLETVVGGGQNSVDCLHLVTELVGTQSAGMVRLGVATAVEIGLETLTERMSKEVISRASVVVGRSEIGAWTRM